MGILSIFSEIIDANLMSQLFYAFVRCTDRAPYLLPHRLSKGKMVLNVGNNITIRVRFGSGVLLTLHRWPLGPVEQKRERQWPLQLLRVLVWSSSLAFSVFVNWFKNASATFFMLLRRLLSHIAGLFRTLNNSLLRSFRSTSSYSSRIQSKQTKLVNTFSCQQYYTQHVHLIESAE